MVRVLISAMDPGQTGKESCCTNFSSLLIFSQWKFQPLHNQESCKSSTKKLDIILILCEFRRVAKKFDIRLNTLNDANIDILFSKQKETRAVHMNIAQVYNYSYEVKETENAISREVSLI